MKRAAIALAIFLIGAGSAGAVIFRPIGGGVRLIPCAFNIVLKFQSTCSLLGGVVR